MELDKVKVDKYGSNVEGVTNNLNRRRASVNLDGHNVEPARTVRHTVAQQVLVREQRDPALLRRRDGLGRAPEPTARPRLHLDKHQHPAVARDDIQFSAADAKPAGNNCVPTAFELPARQIFPAFPQDDSRLGHA
jgi:hypothetical protein